jgi:8-oxo-dGTP pyrophosphatase MutT (NUDIX family)
MRAFLLVWGRVPRLWRRWIVRLIAPSFTVGAACVIERDDGSILLVRLVYRNGWGLPGGLIKRKEDVAACARREVKEEIGLDVELISEPAVVVDSGPQRIDVVFRARPAPGVDPVGAHARSVELREVAWFRAGELPELQHEAVSALMALASSALGPAEPGAVADDGDVEAGSDAALRLAAARAAGQR